MNNRFKNLLIATLTISIVFSGFTFRQPIRPREVNAIIVFDPKAWWGWLKDHADKIYEHAKKVAFAALKRRVLNMLTDQAVKWIQGGGKEKFVTDWKKLIRDAQDQAIGDIIADDPNLSFLCQPFRAQLKLTLPLVPIPKFSQEAKCTFNQIKVNIKDFGKDFRAGVKGGNWIGYRSIYEPQNNFIGASLIGEYQIQNAQGIAQTAKLAEVGTGGGFIGQQECQEGNTPGPDIDGDKKPNDISSTCKIVTPGAVGLNFIAKTFGSDFDFITNATEYSEIAVALANAVWNRLMKGGAKSLAGATVPDDAQLAATKQRLDQDFERIALADLETTYTTLNGQINEPLAPRLSANTTINQTMNLIDNFKNTDTAKIYDRLKSNKTKRCTEAGFSDPQYFKDVAHNYILIALVNIAWGFPESQTAINARCEENLGCSAALKSGSESEIKIMMRQYISSDDLANIINSNYFNKLKTENQTITNQLTGGQCQLNSTYNGKITDKDSSGACIVGQQKLLNEDGAPVNSTEKLGLVSNAYSGIPTAALNVDTAANFLDARQLDKTTVQNEINKAITSINALCD